MFGQQREQVAFFGFSHRQKVHGRRRKNANGKKWSSASAKLLGGSSGIGACFWPANLGGGVRRAESSSSVEPAQPLRTRSTTCGGRPRKARPRGGAKEICGAREPVDTPNDSPGSGKQDAVSFRSRSGQERGRGAVRNKEEGEEGEEKKGQGDEEEVGLEKGTICERWKK